MLARSPSRILLLALGLIPFSCCQGEDKASANKAPRPSEVVIRVQDMAFTDAELNAYVPFLKGADSSLSEGYIRHYLINDVLIPAALARKALDPAIVKEARQKAEDLATAVRSAGGDLATLKRYGDPLGGKESPFPLFKTNDLELAAARAAFIPEIGVVSGAIHGIWGSYVLSPTSLVPGPAGSADSRKVYAVFFPYSGESDLKSSILGKASTFRLALWEVHPRYFPELRPLVRDIRVLSKD